jgi:hypothetical protein
MPLKRKNNVTGKGDGPFPDDLKLFGQETASPLMVLETTTPDRY